MPVFKATITVTLFQDELDIKSAENMLTNLSLEKIAQEMDEGLMIGNYVVTSMEEIPANRIVSELETIGNDGTFFDYASPDE